MGAVEIKKGPIVMGMRRLRVARGIAKIDLGFGALEEIGPFDCVHEAFPVSGALKGETIHRCGGSAALVSPRRGWQGRRVNFDIDRFVTDTLAEDLGEAGDITSAAVIPAEARFTGVMDSREAIVVAGLPIAEAFFKSLDPEVAIERPVEDGAAVPAGTDLMRLSGKARALLTAERSALNIVQHLSGIATLTRRYVDAIAGTGAILLDTRKTIPGLRFLEKYATRMGGAQNHRMGLWDAAMIKDNHVAIAGSVDEAVRRAAAAGIERIIVEVDRIEQIGPALQAGATHLLLDNMDVPALREAVALVAGRVPTEASGGVTLETIRAKAETGVTYISVGRLTQSAPAADIGLDFLPA